MPFEGVEGMLVEMIVRGGLVDEHP